MNIAIIGTRRHAARLRGLALADPRVARVVVYHHDPASLSRLNVPCPRVQASSDWSDVTGQDAVIIASPSNSHAEYLKRLAECDLPVYCEKPAATTQAALDWLGANERSLAPRTTFGFNYRDSAFAIAAREVLKSKQHGAPIHLHFVATHGLAFRKGWSDDWRFQTAEPFDRLIGNLGIHYIDLCQNLFGEIESASASEALVSGGPATDNAVVNLVHSGSTTAHIMLSYTAPYANAAELHLTDGRLEMRDGKVAMFAPRDYFGPDGRYATPPERLLSSFASSGAYFDDAIARRLTRFLDRVEKNGDEPAPNFRAALQSCEWVLRLTDGAVKHEKP
jgi:predicted dehydrogenase